MSVERADEWLDLAISDIAVFGSGDLISVARLSARSAAHPVPVYGGNGIAGYTSMAMVDRPTVILGRVGQKCGVVYRNDGPVWITDNALYARQFTRPLDVNFFAYALEAARLNDVKNRNDLPLITQSILNDVRIRWPDAIEEQQRIAGVLTDVDDRIVMLERMIAKKRAIKQGMMQQLLTDKTASAGSRASVTDAALGAITTWLSGGTPDRNNPTYWGGTIPWISAATLKRSRVHDSDQHLTNAGVHAGSKLAPAGAVLVLVRGMALHRETRIGMTTRPVSFNQDVKALIPKPGILAEYLLYALQARSFQLLDLVSSAGSGTGVLNTQLLQRLPIWVPDEAIQRQIIAAVDAADREIGLLGQRLAKARDVKQGMMQQLLSGRTRLPVDEDAA